MTSKSSNFCGDTVPNLGKCGPSSFQGLEIITGVSRRKFLGTLGAGAAALATVRLAVADKKLDPAQFKLHGVPDLPAWFEQNRVQAHCEMYRLQDDSGGLELYPPIHQAGAQAVTAIMDNLDEGAWWPTAVGETHLYAKNRDMAHDIIASIHQQGLKCIGYYRAMSDAWAQQTHPDWIARDAQGKPVHEPRGKKSRHAIYVLCINSPYRDFIQTRLCELATRGIDMIYFDSWHMPEVCTCAFCRRKFAATTGQAFPLKSADTPSAKLSQVDDADGKINLGGEYSDDYLRVSRFVTESLIETFTQWREAVQRINPNIRFAIGSSLYPVFLGQPQLAADFVAIADSSKTEFKKEFGGNAKALKHVSLPGFSPPSFDVQTALGWSLVRDATAGRPPLLWMPNLESEADARHAAAAVWSYGCVASLAVQRSTHMEFFQSAYADNDKIGPALAYTRPYGWLAVHVSEKARNRRLNTLVDEWRDVIAPALGAFEAAVRQHWPVVTINDSQLAHEVGAKTRVLVLASPDELTVQQNQVVQKWADQGGVVIRLPQPQDWYSAAGKSGAISALVSEVLQRAGSPPVRVQGPPSLHAVCFRHPSGRHLVVNLVAAWDDYESTVRQPRPVPCRSVSIELDRHFFPATRATELISGKTWSLTGSNHVNLVLPEFATHCCMLFDGEEIST